MTIRTVGHTFERADALPHFVDGRLLTAADLATGQATLRERDRRAGRAAGGGVVSGLRVTASATTVTVAPGLGLVASGEPVRLAEAVTLPLAAAVTAQPATGGVFSCCTPATPTSASPVGAGCHVLVARPADRLAGSAPAAGPPGSQAGGCGPAWEQGGVGFAVVAIPLPDTVCGVPVTAANRRNLLAQWCFGTERLATLGVDPFTGPPGYGGLDELADLGADDLPLAVLHWDGAAVTFVDNWSARRRVTAPDPVAGPWSSVLADRRAADGEARFLQVQEQTAELIATGTASGVAAAETLPVLAPVGFLPVAQQPVVRAVSAVALRVERAEKRERLRRRGIDLDLADAGEDGEEDPTLRLARSVGSTALRRIVLGASAQPLGGFQPVRFFGASAQCGGILDWDVVQFALHQSYAHAAVVVAQPPPGGAPEDDRPLAWYLVAQNLAAVQKAPPGTGPGLYLVWVAKTWFAGRPVLPFTPVPPPTGGPAPG